MGLNGVWCEIYAKYLAFSTYPTSVVNALIPFFLRGELSVRVFSSKISKNLAFRPVWSPSSNNNFHILNNITYISIYFFIHTYFKKLQTTILKLLYQTPLSISKTDFIYFNNLLYNTPNIKRFYIFYHLIN